MPEFLLIGGPNGAGKSTIAPALIREVLGGAPFVNADVIARGMGGPARADEMAMAAGRQAIERIRALLKERSSFAFESTLSSRSLANTLDAIRIATGDALLKHKLLRQSIVTYDRDGYIFHVEPDDIVTHLTPEEEAEAIATAGHGTWFAQ